MYANSNRSNIEEQVYPSNVQPQKILNLLEWMDDEWINLATKKLIGDKPNTFAYTKWIAETLLQQEASDLPVVIVRPSTIGAAWKEPFSVIFLLDNSIIISTIFVLIILNKGLG